MKRKLPFLKINVIIVFLALCLISNSLTAQIDTAFWDGSQGTTWVNTENVMGAGVLYSSSNKLEGDVVGTYLNPKDTWTNNITNDPDLNKVYPKIGFIETYPGQSTAGWPANVSNELSDVWFQFYVTPSGTEDIHIETISFSVLALGTSNLKANFYISTDSTFANRTQIAPTLGLSTSVFTDIVVTGMDTIVKPNQKLYFRVHPWYQAVTSSTSKYVIIKNVRFITPREVDVTDSKLTQINTNGTRIADFSPTKTSYDIELLYGTTQVPLLTAVTSEPDATVEITNAASAPGTSTIVVTAIDKSTTTYTVNFTQAADEPLLAFPGAEGYGKYCAGGRGGTVYEVTNLKDDGLLGSLRYAVEQSGPRTVVFRVSGTIVLNSDLKISNPYITIAGQTAPGDGICLRKYSLLLDGANNVIIRYIRVRLGNESGGESDAVSGRGASNIILDHVSASWSVDETMSVYFCNNITIQWSLIAESLFNSNHPKGNHGFGGIAGSDNSTYHHNLFAHHSSRNPRMSSGCGYFDYRNNVVYNWGYNSTYGGENQQSGDVAHTFSKINMVANYYKPGPATQPGEVTNRIANPNYRTVTSDYGKWYVADNVMEGNATVTADNWNGGVQPQGGSADYQYVKLTSAWVAMPINEQTASNAFYSVLDNVGATLPKRDAVDTHVVHDALSGDATSEGPTYKTLKTVPNTSVNCGIIDVPSNVGGWPELNSTTAPSDTDYDGMPDDWETAHQLNPSDSTDGNLVAANGYTNLENYLNGIEFNYQVGGYGLTILSANSYKLVWADNYLAETGFKVERSDNNGAFTEIADLPQYSNTYTDNAAPTGLVAYRVIAYNSDNATPELDSISSEDATLPNAINTNSSAGENVKYYPSPVESNLNIELHNEFAENALIQLFDYSGRLFLSSKVKGTLQTIEMGNLKAGLYIVKVSNSNKSEVIKIVKQ